jgi:hypothetical protein
VYDLTLTGSRRRIFFGQFSLDIALKAHKSGNEEKNINCKRVEKS